MSDAQEVELPKRVAGECELPDGSKVWVQTLSEPQRERAIEEAQWTAADLTAPFLPGGRRRKQLEAEIREKSKEDHAAYLAGHELFMGRILQKAEDENPIPPKPKRKALDEQSDTEWAAVCKKWKAAREKVLKARAAAQERLWEEERVRLLAPLEPDGKKEAFTREELYQKRIEAVCEAKYRRELNTAFVFEILAKAVRRVDDHYEMVYPHAQAVEEDPDADKIARLKDFYFAVDPVDVDEVPT